MDHTLFGPGEIAWRLAAVLALVFANGFFVAAEFALVTVRKTRIDQLIAEGSSLARPVRRAITDPDSYIAATQLAITMTSLGLGWIGEPAVSSMIQPALGLLPIPLREATSHTIAVALGFAVITALHIVLGELAPKTVALQHAERTALIVGRPTELFMRVFWPFITTAEQDGPGRRADARPEAAERQFAGALRGRAEDARHGQPGGRRHRRRRRADAAPRLRVRRPDGGPGDAAAHRDDGAAGARLARRICSKRLSQATQLVIPVYGAHLDDIVGVVRMRDLLGVLAAIGRARRPDPDAARTADRAGDAQGRRSADRHAQAPDAAGHRHRRVRRHGRAGDLRAADGAHRRRNRIRRRQRHVGHHRPDRRLGAHRRAGAHDRRERAVRPATSTRTSTTRSAATSWAVSAGGRGSATASRSAGGRSASRRSTDCASPACCSSTPSSTSRTAAAAARWR